MEVDLFIILPIYTFRRPEIVIRQGLYLKDVQT